MDMTNDGNVSIVAMDAGLVQLPVLRPGFSSSFPDYAIKTDPSFILTHST